MADLIVRPAAGREDARRIFTFLVLMHEELGVVPVDPVKALAAIADVVMNEAAYVVEDEGVIVASMGLYKTDWWFSPDSFLTEMWLYVRPDRRDSPAFGLLLKEARTLSEMTDLPVVLHAWTAKRAAARTGLQKTAQRFSFMPNGQAMTIWPTRSPAHGR